MTSSVPLAAEGMILAGAVVSWRLSCRRLHSTHTHTHIIIGEIKSSQPAPLRAFVPGYCLETSLSPLACWLLQREAHYIASHRMNEMGERVQNGSQTSII